MKSRTFVLLMSFLTINNLIAQDLKYNNEPTNAFDGLKYSSIATGKVNDDKYYDIMVSGELETGEWVTKLYLNNPDNPGSFTEYASQKFHTESNAEVELKDLNGDKALDIIISGNEGVFIYYSKKKGKVFKEYKIISNAKNYRFGDIDGDNDLDIICYFNPSWKGFSTTKFSSFINNGEGEFAYKDFNLSGFSQTRELELTDLNSDGNDDLVIFATKDKSILDKGHTVFIYLNDANGGFSEYKQPNFEFETIQKGKLKIVDNYLKPSIKDILVTGEVDYQQETILYKNDGQGNFSTNPYFEQGGVSNGEIASGDFDHKLGDDYLFIGDYKTIVYLSSVNTTHSYIKADNHPFEKIVKHGSIVVEDFNGDYLEDVLIIGLDANGKYFSKIYFCDE